MTARAYLGRTAHHPPCRAGAILACLLTAGCMRTTIRSGTMPGETAAGWEERWHHSFVLGLIEVPGPVETKSICPRGWSQIDSQLDPLQAALALLSLGIYTPSTISVVCTAHER